MRRTSLSALFMACSLVIGSALMAFAQEATPTPGGARERQPSQYAFYPSQVAQPGGDLPGDPAVQLVRVGGDFAEPVNVAAPNDGSGRIFVVERGGTIRIVGSDGATLPEPFLDISSDVTSDFLEQGLLGLAFHPDFANNGLFYVNYTNQLHGGDVLTVQYTVSADDPNKADPASGLIVSSRDQPYPNHIGGDIQFGPDGMLYIGHGDGGLEGDPLDAGQRLDTHLGKMLRIDVSPAVAAATGQQSSQAPVGGQAYTIPAGNPFIQRDVVINLFDATEEQFAQLHPTAMSEIWDWGLRNPWSFSFDRQTGDLWIGDVGQNFWEEVDMEPAGSGGGWNYGWKFLQGSHCFPASMTECPQVGVLPVAEYPHDEATGGCTVVGGSVYRGQQFSSLQGTYFHSDYCQGRIWGIAMGDDGTWQMQQLLDTSLLVTGHGEDESGEIYFTSCECGYGQRAPNRVGAVWHLVAADQVPEGAEVAPTGEEAPATPAAEGSPAPTSAASPAAASGNVQLEAYDIGWKTPDQPGPSVNLTVSAGATIEITNTGAAQHNFTADQLGIKVDLPPGGSGTAQIPADAQPGTYDFICSIPGHAEAGMTGTLTIQ